MSHAMKHLERQQGIVIITACGVLLVPYLFFPFFFLLSTSKHPILMLFFKYF